LGIGSFRANFKNQNAGEGEEDIDGLTNSLDETASNPDLIAKKVVTVKTDSAFTLSDLRMLRS